MKHMPSYGKSAKDRALKQRVHKSPFEIATGRCDSCGSADHKTSGHGGLVKSGKITR